MDRKTLVITPVCNTEFNLKLYEELKHNIISTHLSMWNIILHPVFNDREGVVRPINKGLRKALEMGNDVIVVTDDIRWSGANCFNEMKKIAYSDEKIGLVSAFRSSHTFIRKDNNKKEDYIFALWGLVFIKFNILQKFGILDKNYFLYGFETDYSINLQNNGYKQEFYYPEKLKHINLTGTSRNAFGSFVPGYIQKKDLEYRNNKWGFKNEC